MKKIMIALVALAALAFSSCEEMPTMGLNGTWNIDSVYTDEAMVTGYPVATGLTYSIENSIIEQRDANDNINSSANMIDLNDSSFYSESANSTEFVKYSFDDSKLILKFYSEDKATLRRIHVCSKS